MRLQFAQGCTSLTLSVLLSLLVASSCTARQLRANDGVISSAPPASAEGQCVMQISYEARQQMTTSNEAFVGTFGLSQQGSVNTSITSWLFAWTFTSGETTTVSDIQPASNLPVSNMELYQSSPQSPLSVAIAGAAVLPQMAAISFVGKHSSSSGGQNACQATAKGLQPDLSGLPYNIFFNGVQCQLNPALKQPLLLDGTKVQGEPVAVPLIQSNMPEVLKVEYMPITYTSGTDTPGLDLFSTTFTQLLFRLSNPGSNRTVALSDVVLQYWFDASTLTGGSPGTTSSADGGSPIPGTADLNGNGSWQSNYSPSLQALQFKMYCSDASPELPGQCDAVKGTFSPGLAGVKGAEYVLNLSFSSNAGFLLPAGIPENDSLASILLRQSGLPAMSEVAAIISIEPDRYLQQLNARSDYSYLDTPLLGNTTVVNNNNLVLKRQLEPNPHFPAFVAGLLAWGSPPKAGDDTQVKSNDAAQAVLIGPEAVCTTTATYCCPLPNQTAFSNTTWPGTAPDLSQIPDKWMTLWHNNLDNLNASQSNLVATGQAPDGTLVTSSGQYEVSGKGKSTARIVGAVVGALFGGLLLSVCALVALRASRSQAHRQSRYPTLDDPDGVKPDSELPFTPRNLARAVRRACSSHDRHGAAGSRSSRSSHNTSLLSHGGSPRGSGVASHRHHQATQSHLDPHDARRADTESAIFRRCSTLTRTLHAMLTACSVPTGTCMALNEESVRGGDLQLAQQESLSTTGKLISPSMQNVGQATGKRTSNSKDLTSSNFDGTSSSSQQGALALSEEDCEWLERSPLLWADKYPTMPAVVQDNQQALIDTFPQLLRLPSRETVRQNSEVPCFGHHCGGSSSIGSKVLGTPTANAALSKVVSTVYSPVPGNSKAIAYLKTVSECFAANSGDSVEGSKPSYPGPSPARYSSTSCFGSQVFVSSADDHSQLLIRQKCQTWAACPSMLTPWHIDYELPLGMEHLAPKARHHASEHQRAYAAAAHHTRMVLPPAAKVDLSINFDTEIKPYLGRLIGVGAYGRVHEAVWRGKPVAIKIMKCETLQEYEVLVKEVEVCAHFRSCPQIISLLGACLRGTVGQGNDMSAQPQYPPLQTNDSLLESQKRILSPLELPGGYATPALSTVLEDASQSEAQNIGTSSDVGSGNQTDAPACAVLTTSSTNQHGQRCAASASAGEQNQLPDVPQQQTIDSSKVESCTVGQGSKVVRKMSAARERTLAVVGSSTGRAAILAENTVPDQVAFIMELADCNLAYRLHSGAYQPPTLTEMLQVSHDIAAGLAVLHAAGVIHRDLKPQNVLLLEGRAKIADFGLSRLKDPFRSCVSVTQQGGTPQYMAPEQFAGMRVDEKCDVYALGCIMNEILSGRVPWSDDSQGPGSDAAGRGGVYHAGMVISPRSPPPRLVPAASTNRPGMPRPVNSPQALPAGPTVQKALMQDAQPAAIVSGPLGTGATSPSRAQRMQGQLPACKILSTDPVEITQQNSSIHRVDEPAIGASSRGGTDAAEAAQPAVMSEKTPTNQSANVSERRTSVDEAGSSSVERLLFSRDRHQQPVASRHSSPQPLRVVDPDVNAASSVSSLFVSCPNAADARLSSHDVSPCHWHDSEPEVLESGGSIERGEMAETAETAAASSFGVVGETSVSAPSRMDLTARRARLRHEQNNPSDAPIFSAIQQKVLEAAETQPANEQGQQGQTGSTVQPPAEGLSSETVAAAVERSPVVGGQAALFQIILAVAVHGKRPAIPPYTPLGLRSLIQQCWKENPKARPTISQVKEVLEDLLQKEQGLITQSQIASMRRKSQSKFARPSPRRSTSSNS